MVLRDSHFMSGNDERRGVPVNERDVMFCFPIVIWWGAGVEDPAGSGGVVLPAGSLGAGCGFGAGVSNESRGLFPLVCFSCERACLCVLVLVCLFLRWGSFLSCVICLRVASFVLFHLFVLVLSYLCYSFAYNTHPLALCLVFLFSCGGALCVPFS
jgi:hypothetical protein